MPLFGVNFKIKTLIKITSYLTQKSNKKKLSKHSDKLNIQSSTNFTFEISSATNLMDHKLCVIQIGR